MKVRRQKATPKLYALDVKKHGVGGLLRHPPRYRKQDKRAKSFECFAVVFFPRVRGLWRAAIYQDVFDKLAQTPAAARAKFLDGLAPLQSWRQYHRAGHRIRRIKITDLGDA